MEVHASVTHYEVLGCLLNRRARPGLKNESFVSAPRHKNAKTCTYTNERVREGSELHRLTRLEIGHCDDEAFLCLLARRGSLGVEAARIEDVPEFLQWIRAGIITRQHPDSHPNAIGGIYSFLPVCAYFNASANTTEFCRLTGRMTVTVILQPGLMGVLGRGDPIWILCANALETASEARVRNDASFIIGSNEGRCNGHGSKWK